MTAFTPATKPPSVATPDEEKDLEMQP